MTGVRRVDIGEGRGFDIWTQRGAEAGPRVAILGGVHGDETEGYLAAGHLAAADLGIVRGTVDVIPVCHEAAFEIDSRTSPLDDGNLARVFPGDPNGSPTERLAHHINAEVLQHADLLIDMHTSGKSYDMPFLAGYRGETPDTDGLARAAAEVFAADFLWRHPERSEGRTVSVVDQAIYIECPGGGRTKPGYVKAYVAGVIRILAMMGMTDTEPDIPTGTPIRVTGGGNLDRDMLSVSAHGLFLSDVSHGDRVASGQRLGVVVDTKGNEQEQVHAARPGYVMALKARSPVAPGDLVICLADEDI